MIEETKILTLDLIAYPACDWCVYVSADPCNGSSAPSCPGSTGWKPLINCFDPTIDYVFPDGVVYYLIVQILPDFHSLYIQGVFLILFHCLLYICMYYFRRLIFFILYNSKFIFSAVKTV